jgi:hypothetical protein
VLVSVTCQSADDDDVFYLLLQKQKIGTELKVYLEEGTYHKTRKLAILAVSAVRGRLRCLGPVEILRGRLRFS